jgi:hypothetical protein
MTDQAQAGSVAAVEQPAGAPATPAVTTDNGSAVTTEQTPFSGLSEGARKWVDTKGYKSHEDVVSAALSLEQKLGTSVSVPAPDAPKEEWAKFHAKLPEAMRPVESADKITYTRPEGLPLICPTMKGWQMRPRLGRQRPALLQRWLRPITTNSWATWLSR